MNLIIKNISKSGLIIIFMILIILVSVFLVSKNKNKILKEERILSKTDYRIFHCGEEIFLEADRESLITKRNGLFARSKKGSIIVDGTPLNNEDILLTSFFDAAGGTLKFSDEYGDIFRIPTETGIREFRFGDLCNGKEANLYVLHHRIETSTKPWSIYSRIMWKYFDHVLTNNYGKVPPGDCIVFIFDSEDILGHPWPYCTSHEDAIIAGKLILEN